MWRPGFVFYSNSYFLSDLLQAPRPAGIYPYIMCYTDFVKDTDETGPSDFNFEIENRSDFDFNIERCDTHTTFQKIQNRNRPTFQSKIARISIGETLKDVSAHTRTTLTDS